MLSFIFPLQIICLKKIKVDIIYFSASMDIKKNQFEALKIVFIIDLKNDFFSFL